MPKAAISGAPEYPDSTEDSRGAGRAGRSTHAALDKVVAEITIVGQFPTIIHSDSYNAPWERPFMEKSKNQDRSKGAMEQDSQIKMATAACWAN